VRRLVALVTRTYARAGYDVDAIRMSVRAHHFASRQELLQRHGIDRARVHPDASPLEAVVDALRDRAVVEVDVARLEGLGYYDGPCLRISACDPKGARFPLVDGGFTDWMERLMSDRKEKLLCTGIGVDLACATLRVAC
jgi:hypothetical protein